MEEIPITERKPWSKARRHSFIVACLRSGTRRYPPKYLTLNEAKTEKKINVKTGRLAQHYMCASCEGEFPAKGINVDHIEPATGPEGFTTWDSFIEKLFCEKENFQILCVECHKKKSKKEQDVRKENNCHKRR